jgi:hypothetical protein
MTESNSPWRLIGQRAALTFGNLSANIDLRAFDLGLHDVTWAGSPLDTRVLGMGLPLVVDKQPAISESYIRGNDLIASFERPGPLAAVPQVYWRVRPESAPSTIGVELIVSMRTDLLDSQPETRVVTEFGLAALRNQPVRIIDLPGGASYFQLVHPDDVFAVEERFANGRYRITTTLFPERLEKGVIRRARICGWFLPTENDLAVVVELARQFVAEPPPLTT